MKVESTSGPFPTTLVFQFFDQDDGTEVKAAVTGGSSGPVPSSASTPTRHDMSPSSGQGRTASDALVGDKATGCIDSFAAQLPDLTAQP